MPCLGARTTIAGFVHQANSVAQCNVGSCGVRAPLLLLAFSGGLGFKYGITPFVEKQNQLNKENTAGRIRHV